MNESTSNNLCFVCSALQHSKNQLPHIDADPRKQAIESHEPLVLVNADKSIGSMAILLHRINYMTQSGLEYDKIAVISATNADSENYAATCRFTGNTTVEKFAKKISGKYPVYYKHLVIHGVLDEQADDIAEILQYAADKKVSLFIIGDAETSNVMTTLMDSGTFSLYNMSGTTPLL